MGRQTSQSADDGRGRTSSRKVSSNILTIRVSFHRCVVREWYNPSGAAVVTCLNATARTRRAEGVVQSDVLASITASATFGHSASPDNGTCWHIMALQGAMQVYVKYFDNFFHHNPLYSHHL
jgi:hypothetical protein